MCDVDGVPVANRNRVETERLIGFFVNTQVLKADIDGQMGFERLLHQVRQRFTQNVKTPAIRKVHPSVKVLTRRFSRPIFPEFADSPGSSSVEDLTYRDIIGRWSPGGTMSVRDMDTSLVR